MTELFGRLAPGATLEGARAELKAVHASMVHAHPESYSPRAHVGLEVKTLRDQLASPARTILLLLLAAAAVVFVIACSNVANLILGRSVRRESELAVRAALGASRGALRRTLLAESLVLCVAGAALGCCSRGRSWPWRPAMPRASPSARWRPGWTPACSGSARGWRWWRRCCSRMCRGSPPSTASSALSPARRRHSDHAGHEPPSQDLRDDADRVLLPAARGRRHAGRDVECDVDGEHRL